MGGEQDGEQASELGAAAVSRLDRLLLALLREDSRRSQTELALRLGVSRTTVKEHMERLRERGIILRYTIEVAEPAAELPDGVGAFFHLTLHRPFCKAVHAAVRGWPELMGCWSIAGDIDMTLFVHCRSQDHLEDLRDRLARLDAVASLRTAPVLRDWPV